MKPIDSVQIDCPYCGETFEITIDASARNQSYIEDCQVCCKPINLSVSLDEEGEPQIEATAEDE